MFRNRLILLLFTFLSLNVYSKDIQRVSYKIESDMVFSDGDYSPFWLISNRYGLSSIKNSWGLLKAGTFYNRSFAKSWNFNAAVEIASMYNCNSDLVIQQAYADIAYKRLFLSVGVKEEDPYFTTSKLSSGNLIEGINSRPVPRIKLGLDRYVDVPFTNSWVKIKGYLSFGWFADNDWQRSFVNKGAIYTNNVLVHRKEIYLKFGKPNKLPVEFEVGLNHGAQFGGERWRKGDREVIEKMPHSFSDYLRIIFGKEGGKKSLLGEQQNALGNHLGSWNFALTLKINDYLIKAYYEHMFEDGSGMYFGYGAWRDGLIGLKLKMPKKGWLNEVVLEKIMTKRQTASIMNEGWKGIPDVIMGRDNYYNNGIYLAWQHYGMGIGNPLLTSPLYNNNGQITFMNNRINGYHLGISGNLIPSLEYKALITYTENYGTYNNPFDNKEKQLNSMFELSYSPTCMKGWTFSGAIAYDKGKVTGNNFGGMISIKKVGNINFNCSKRK